MKHLFVTISRYEVHLQISLVTVFTLKVPFSSIQNGFVNYHNGYIMQEQTNRLSLMVHERFERLSNFLRNASIRRLKSSSPGNHWTGIINILD